MAYSPHVAKGWYQHLSVQELEQLYEDMTKAPRFASKEAMILDTAEYRLDASRNTNFESRLTAIEELLTEKTGKKYYFQAPVYHITYLDVINTLEFKTEDPNVRERLTKFFKALHILGRFKTEFLFDVVQDDKMFAEFYHDVVHNKNVKQVYKKHSKIIDIFISRNSRIG